MPKKPKGPEVFDPGGDKDSETKNEKGRYKSMKGNEIESTIYYAVFGAKSWKAREA